jgi:hypothetical protein
MFYKTGILTNTKTGRFHPIFFRLAPMPGGAEIAGALRYKSAQHHTAGFDTLEEAEADLVKASTSQVLEGVQDSGRRWDWDGEGVPAMVEFF